MNQAASLAVKKVFTNSNTMISIKEDFALYMDLI